MIGGESKKDSLPSSRVDVVNLQSSRLFTFQNLQFSRRDHSAVASSISIFVFGGITRSGVVTSECETFDYRNNK